MPPKPRWWHGFGREADQAASEADQTASDSDQTTADSNQSIAEREQEAADADQVAADRDQAAADREFESQPPTDTSGSRAHEEGLTERGAGRLTRADTTAVRLEIAAEREARATDRDMTARRRDTTAAERDLAADLADRDAERLAHDLDATDPRAKKALEAAAQARKRAAAARSRAAEDRERAAADREVASRERGLLQEEIQRANLDELTGSFRRGMGEVVLRHEMERSRRSHGPMTLIFIDIDNLKTTNDRGGHEAGDTVLRNVFSTLKDTLRPYDPIVRWGGDEFVCAISGADRRQAHDRVTDAQHGLRKLDPNASFTFDVEAGRERSARTVTPVRGRLVAARERRRWCARRNPHSPRGAWSSSARAGRHR